MSWRDNELAVNALAVQGYYDEETRTVHQDALVGSLAEIFLRNPVRAAKIDILDRKKKLFETGITREDLLDKILPGFRAKYELNDEEAALLKKSAKDHPDLEQRDRAVSDLGSYLWGTLSKTGRNGAVQVLLVQKSLLLIDSRAPRDNVQTPIKAATDDQDLIIEFYVRPRGDQLVRVSGGVRDDCTMVGMTFEGINDRMKRELGVSVTTAVGRLLQVATPDLGALNMHPPRDTKPISSGSTKG
jgi:hypothetical protein